MKIQNNIKTVLEEQGVSILKLSQMIGMDYSSAHALVGRESLRATQLGTLVDVSEHLNVPLEKLFKIIKK